MISFSNKPQVLGFVIIAAANSLSILLLKSFKSNLPATVDLIVITSNPKKAAVAGFVP